MGWTAEMLAQDFGVKRERMDEIALTSHTRAFEANKAGRFKDEIVPVETTIIDDAGVAKTVVIEADDGLRQSTLEGLEKAKPVFPQWGGGVSTAANSSQVRRAHTHFE